MERFFLIIHFVVLGLRFGRAGNLLFHRHITCACVVIFVLLDRSMGFVLLFRGSRAFLDFCTICIN